MRMNNRLEFCAGFTAAVLMGGVAIALLGPPPTQALERTKNEREVLKACEKRLCEIIVKKDTAGDDLLCPLSKTWAQASIKGGVEKRSLSWAFGDARCSVDLNAKRDTIVGAVTKPEHALELSPHEVKCEVEREGEITPINVTLAPKVSFKNGKAEKAWLNVSSIEAPAVVKGAIWTAAQLEDTFGLFHSEMISEINEFIEEKCPKTIASM